MDSSRLGYGLVDDAWSFLRECYQGACRRCAEPRARVGGGHLGLSGGTLTGRLASLLGYLILLGGDGSGLLASSGSSGSVNSSFTLLRLSNSLVGFLLVLDFFLVLGSLLLSVLIEDLVVVRNGLLGSLPSSLLVGLVDSLSSESGVSDQSLDLGSLVSDGLAFLFDLSSDDESSDIIILGQSEKFSDSGGSLGSESLGLLGVGKTSNGLFTNLDDSKGDDGKIGSDDASSDGLSLSFSSSSRSVASGVFSHQESNSAVGQDTLLHRETLFVVSSHDLNNVSLELVTKGISLNLL